MPWKQGRVTFDDGSTYNADLLVNEKGQVYNMKVYKGDKVIKEIDVQAFASELGKTPEDIYPYKFDLGR
ncbi:hypothetical protein [Desnuesiella massiliensis]|uniref:hypothetical protein n=1 Tax=Desnuesiella massiliensis TaxID=1650662 RepID=UPI0006E2D7B0|nr:hypothetical protein [Desnuesiella massiliensis]